MAIKKRDVYYCEHCKNLVEVLYAGAPALVCCGEPMKKLEEKNEDSSVEKHVPFVEVAEGGVNVRVGENTPHPMTAEHYINFIEVQTKDMVLRVELNPGDKPEAFFPVSKDEIILVREWCNLHGLWKA